METNNPIISASEFTNFLETGALLRTAPNAWFLLKGPFRQVSDVPAGQVALYHPDFFLSSNQSYWLPDNYYKLDDNQLTRLCDHFQGFAALPPWQWQDAELQSFAQSYASIQERIQSDGLKKAVPIVFERSQTSITPSHLIEMIKHLINAPETLFVYGSWQNGDGVLGATPEILLRQQGVLLQTMALAGTSPKQDKERSSLLSDKKELHEHDLVVQDIENILAQYGSVRLDGPKILELPTLLHLKTDIECELQSPQEFSFFKACQQLHPTPALGVSPRAYGIEWMKELPEQKNRQGFGGPWGLQWSQDEALCLVAIRNLQWSKSESRIGSGCGIVQQSELSQEWRELAQKRSSVKKILGLQS